MAVYSWSWAIFVSFVTISGFLIYNLIVAVVCDAVAVIENRKKEQEEAHVEAEAVDDLRKQKEKIKLMRLKLAVLLKTQTELLEAAEAALSPVSQPTSYPTTNRGDDKISIYEAQRSASAIFTPEPNPSSNQMWPTEGLRVEYFTKGLALKPPLVGGRKRSNSL
jgi:hypothetical protein